MNDKRSTKVGFCQFLLLGSMLLLAFITTQCGSVLELFIIISEVHIF